MIIGAGEVGYYLSERFSGEGHDVVLIDQNVEKLRRLEKGLDVLTVKGNGASAHVLEKAGIEQSDLFIAVTDIDEVNLVSCMIAREYGVERRVARVRNEEFFSEGAPLNQQRLGLDLLINPDIVMAEEIVRLTDLSEAFGVIEFAHGQVELVGYRIQKKNPIVGKSLVQLGKMKGDLGFVIVAIVRGEETVIPRGDDIIAADDRIFVVARRTDVSAIEKLMNLRSQAPKKVFIIGGGRLGLIVARQLETRNIDIRLLEIDADRCQILSEVLEKTIVLNSDGLQTQEMVEEGVGEADLVISVTGNDTTNLLSSLLAKHHGARKCITRIQRPDFVPLLSKLGIDVALSPRVLVARAILKFIRRGAILSVATLLETDSEVLELVVPDKSPICDILLKDLDFPQKANIGAIIRNGKSIVPTGSNKLKSGDNIIVFALKGAVKDVERFFKT
jgi:trk system potassium uptake protein TrkA